MLDRRGARPAVVLGGALGAVGFFLLAGKLTDLSLGAQSLVHRDRRRRARADARPGQHRRGQPRPEHELQRGHRHHPDRAELRRQPRTRRPRRDPDQPERHQRDQRADQARRAAAGSPTGSPRRSAAAARPRGPARGSRRALVHDVQLAFAHSTQTVFYIMAGVMVATFIVAVRWLPRGRSEHVDERSPASAPFRDTGTLISVSADELVTKDWPALGGGHGGASVRPAHREGRSRCSA